jgi:hypothetical protein
MQDLRLQGNNLYIAQTVLPGKIAGDSKLILLAIHTALGVAKGPQ